MLGRASESPNLWCLFEIIRLKNENISVLDMSNNCTVRTVSTLIQWRLICLATLPYRAGLSSGSAFCLQSRARKNGVIFFPRTRKCPICFAQFVDGLTTSTTGCFRSIAPERHQVDEYNAWKTPGMSLVSRYLMWGQCCLKSSNYDGKEYSVLVYVRTSIISSVRCFIASAQSNKLSIQ